MKTQCLFDMKTNPTSFLCPEVYVNQVGSKDFQDCVYLNIVIFLNVIRCFRQKLMGNHRTADKQPHE